MLTETPGVTDPNAQPQQSGLVQMAKDVGQNLDGMERYITDDLRRLAKPDSILMELPQHYTEMFARWDAAGKTPEEHKMYDEIKKSLIEIHETRADSLKNKVASDGERLELQFSVKAIGKVTQAMQSMLSQQS